MTEREEQAYKKMCEMKKAARTVAQEVEIITSREYEALVAIILEEWEKEKEGK